MDELVASGALFPSIAPGSELCLATIGNVYDNGVTLQFAGQDEASVKRYKRLMDGTNFNSGDRVLAVKMSGTYLVVGKLGYTAGESVKEAEASDNTVKDDTTGASPSGGNDLIIDDPGGSIIDPIPSPEPEPEPDPEFHGTDIKSLIERTITACYEPSLRYIGEYAFAGCTALSELYLLNTSFMSTQPVVSVGSGAFNGIQPSQFNIYVPASYYSKYQNFWAMSEAGYRGRLSYASVSSYISCLRSYSGPSFSSSTYASDLIGRYISSYNDENSEITKIGSWAFYSCSVLRTVAFPECSVIRNYAFTFCTKMTEVSFPNCEEIGDFAFLSCSMLREASFPECTTIRQHAFVDCEALSLVSFPKCSYVATRAFSRCVALTAVSFPNCLLLGGYAFCGCPSLSQAILPMCSEISIGAFYNCHSLNTIRAVKCKRVLGNAFYGCENLNTVSLPKCESIFANAFDGCSGLSKILLPKCRHIYAWAFRNCYKLQTVKLLGSNMTYLVDSTAFRSTPIDGYTQYTNGKYGSIYVPASLYNQYITHSIWKYYSSRFVSV